jgi:MFS family permease
MLFFAGWTISSLSITSYADRNGRKMVFVICMLVQIIAVSVILAVPGGPDSMKSVYIIYVMMFLIGISSAGRTAVGYCYMLEMAPQRSHAFMGSSWNIMEGLIFIWLTLYFWLLKISWFWIEFAINIECIILVAIIYFYLPESPKWLYN